MSKEISMSSPMPHILNAIYTWLVDNNQIPYVLLDASELTAIPSGHIRNGKLVLNIGVLATGEPYFIDHNGFSVSCSINNVRYSVVVPLDKIESIYGKDSGNGFNFMSKRFYGDMFVKTITKGKPTLKLV